MAIGADSVGLLFKIRADSKDAQNELKSFRKTIDDESKNVLTLKDRFNQLGTSMGLSSSQMATMGKVAPAAGAALATVAGAAVAAGAAIFAMTKRTSDAGSQIFDLHRSIGLTTETLSGLKVAAEESSSTLGTVEVGVRRLIATARDAATGSDEAREKLRRFGVEPQEVLTNLEGALDKVIRRIGELPEGAQRAAAAQLAFGRGGGELVATLETMGFSLENARKKADELGVLFSGKGARDADDFGDALTELQTAASGVANTFAKEVMPEITGVMQSLTGEFGKNRSAVQEWGESFAEVMRGARVVAESDITAILSGVAQATGAIHLLKIDPTGLRGIVGGLKAFGGAARAADAASGDTTAAEWAEAQRNARGKQGTPTADILFANEKAAEERRKAAEKAAKEAEQLRERERAAEERAAAHSLQSLQEFHAHQLRLREIADDQARAKEKRRLEESKKNLDQSFQAHEEYERALIVLEMNTMIERQRMLMRQHQVAVQVGADSESRQKLVREIEALAAELKAFDAEIKPRIKAATQEDTEARLKNVAAIHAQVDAINRQAEALLRLNAAGPQATLAGSGLPLGPQNFQGGPMLPPGQLVPNAEDPMFGPPPEAIGIWDEWKNAASAALTEVGDQAITTQGVVSALFSGMTNAIAGGINAWATGAASFGKAMKQILASALASIAAEAAIRSLFELGKAFASLFLNPAAAAAHFKASAIFAGVAIAAGAGARLTAGGGGNSGAGYGAAASAANDPYSQHEGERTRRLREQQEADRSVTRENRQGGGIIQLIVDGKVLGQAFVDDIRRGGDNRDGLKTALGVT